MNPSITLDPRVAVRWLAAALLALACLPAAGQEPGRGYRLSAGDKIAIAVFGEPELSLTERVGETGRIAYPFLGELEVKGLTVQELESRLLARLKGDYLVDPKVSVSIAEYRPFFVNGQVRSPGSYPYQPGLTVRRAISLAGGLTERASERQVTLISEGERTSGKGSKVSMDDVVGPGDILTVGESFF